MAKKKVNDDYSSGIEQGVDTGLPSGMPPEAEKKLKEIKDKLDKFQKKVMDKFSDYILGIALMPPPKPGTDDEGKEIVIDKSKIYIMVLIDDSDSKKMSKEELKEKLSTIMQSMAKEV